MGKRDMLRNRPRLVGRAIDATTDVVGMVKNKSPVHLQKIFAPRIPSETAKEFQPPVFSKSDADKQFLFTFMYNDSFLFDRLNHPEIETLVHAFEKCRFKPHQPIIQQGEDGDYFYVLKHGKVSFRKDGENVGKAEAGSSFGELSLLYSSPRAVSVFSETECELFRLDQKTFKTVLQTKVRNADKKKLELLRSDPNLQQVDYSIQLKLCRAMIEVDFKPGDILHEEGNRLDALFFIEGGTVRGKNIVVGGSKYEDINFGPGEIFGWKFLLDKDVKISGSVEATSSGKLFIIEGSSLTNLLGGVEHLANKSNDHRLLKSVTVIRDSCLDESTVSAMADSIHEEHCVSGALLTREQTKTNAAMYFVRKGKVLVKSVDGRFDKTITNGGYFGEDQLLADHELLGKGEKPVIKCKYTATALENCVLGVLELAELRKIMNTTLLGLGEDPIVSPIDKSITMKDLQLHFMLGAGSFGQVWLASTKSSSGIRSSYALKVQSKHQLISTGQAESVVSEKNIMARLCNPFILKLVNTYQDERRVYMLTGLLPGGELANVLYNSEYNRVGEEHAKFYAAGILEGLTFMHRRRIVHRDLKPQNVMLNDKGYPVLIDFGFAKYVPEKTFTLCGTPVYIAPEVIRNLGHDKGADHWSLGCMIYEMCEGESPFWKPEMDQLALFKSIVRGRFEVTGSMSVDLKVLLVGLLHPDPHQRLGSLAGGTPDIARSPWFSSLDLAKLRRQEVEAPWTPDVTNTLDMSNFYDVSKHVKSKFDEKEPVLTATEQDFFVSF